ncbi:hypothetical protein [Alkalihalobacillus sp. AL-G]|uniref:hypothetical protein n=1 Tax=Alkalihalobacillus sp. AL-G TaxID=2926399 RepID=UPI00272A7333|nr:hypothetical protein [Alkalihalobacillus sp. AL-G]WLD91605.1 hypothetical protein MOJ78_11155 [Alkalihalobacillus sp. AL-G]
MDNRCMCIACDVKSSRTFKKDFVTILLESAEQINRNYQGDLLIPFDVRNGDELIGVVRDFSKGYELTKKLKDSLAEKNVFLYIGIGLGQLESNELSTIHTMNGSAVLYALDARDRFLKKNHPEARNWLVDEKRSSIFIYSNDYPYQALNALIYSIEDKIHNRSDKQKEVVQVVNENPKLTYEQIGKQMGYKSPKSTVSYLLSRASFNTVKAMEESLVNLLEELQQRYKKEGS